MLLPAGPAHGKMEAREDTGALTRTRKVAALGDEEA